MTPLADTFTIALVYIKPLELFAIVPMLDETFDSDSIPVAYGDLNEYKLGRIGVHNVAIVGPARGDQGTVAAAQFATTVRLTFPNITTGILIGIGGGIPHYPVHDVRLGDVVVGAPETGPAVVQYDLGKRISDDFEHNRTLPKPPATLLRVVNKVEEKLIYGEEDILKTHLERLTRHPRALYHKPCAPDRLFQSTYIHEPGSLCLEHEQQFEIIRQPRPVEGPVVHYSTILSGDTLMRSSQERDLLSRKHNNALCLEMEAAGLMDVLPCLVVRGICDYSDSHKDDAWQRYAAATASAYAREILLNMSKHGPYVSAKTGSMQSAENEAVPVSRQRGGFVTRDNYGVQVDYNEGAMTNNFGGLGQRW